MWSFESTMHPNLGKEILTYRRWIFCCRLARSRRRWPRIAGGRNIDCSFARRSCCWILPWTLWFLSTPRKVLRTSCPSSLRILKLYVQTFSWIFFGKEKFLLGKNNFRFNVNFFWRHKRFFFQKTKLLLYILNHKKSSNNKTRSKIIPPK